MDTLETVNNSFVDDDLPAEVEIIGISFRGSTKIYYFAANGNIAQDGDNAIVETARGLEYGKVTLVNTMVKRENLILPLKNVIRIADKNDDLRYEANREKEKDAFEVCAKKILEHKLNMKLIDVEYTFDNTKLLFYFTSDDRVDFRELVKDLASYFRTRIELRQIGIRDEAKIMGGLGICGRPFCCNTFLPDFVQVSIKMAKEQNLSLNSAKISGACGRLMCCLRYEYETYQEEARRMPKIDTTVVTPDGVGVVTEVKVLQNTVKVILDQDSEKTPKVYHLSVLKPFDKNIPPEQQKTVIPADPTPSDSVTHDSQGGKKEPRDKNGKPKNRQKPPKNNETDTLVDDSVTTKQSDEGGKQNKHQRSHGGKKNRAPVDKREKNPDGSSQPVDHAKKQQPPKSKSDNQPRSNPPKPNPPKANNDQPKTGASDTVAQTPPVTQDTVSNKRNYAPLPSNSIKKGTGRFGGVKTRPSSFGKKDNS